MKNRLINNVQKEISNKINSLIIGASTDGKEALNESDSNFDTKGKYPLGKKVSKLNHLAKFSLNESRSLTPENVKVVDFDMYSMGINAQTTFFILPLDNHLFETKNGRTLNYGIQEFVNFLHENKDISKYTTKNQGITYFNFNDYWTTINESTQMELQKQFISTFLNKTREYPDIN